MKKILLAVLLACFLPNSAVLMAAERSYHSDFVNETQGWSVSNRDDLYAGALDVQLLDVFGIDIVNNSNLAVIGDYAASAQPVQFAVDIAIEHIIFDGREVPRELILELRNHTLAAEQGLPYVSAWTKLGLLGSENSDYVTYTTILPNPQLAQGLPNGWFGYGAEDSSGNPQLPEGISLHDILSNVTEISFSTFVPGHVYGYTYYKMQVKNIVVDSLQASLEYHTAR